MRHLVAPTSDHCPIMLSLWPGTGRVPKIFIFEDMWLRDPSFNQFVSTKWSSLDTSSLYDG